MSEIDSTSQGFDTITHLLERWGKGEREAALELLPRVYDDLHQLAAHYFRNERSDHTLQPTALVHEVCIRLLEQSNPPFPSRGRFFGLAACIMRRALVDHARERASQKRGRDVVKLPLEEAQNAATIPATSILALEDALSDLERIDSHKALIVELRFFGGLSVDEVARCLGSSARTVAREWRRARAFLFNQLSEQERLAL